jgi:hypothetical protein
MSVCLTRNQGLRLLDWHGGQGSALYAVGSSAFAGRCVPASTARRAARELRLAMYGTPARAQRSAAALIRVLERKAQ